MKYVVLLFCDTKSEDPDLYRFIQEGVDSLGCEFVTLADGRDIWAVFRDEKFLGNTRADPCSKILKRQLARRWVDAHCTPETHTMVFGFSACERNRFGRTALGWGPYRCIAPLCEPPTTPSDDVRGEFTRECPDIAPPRLYALGAKHNNCGGLCVKAGQKHFAWALRVIPELYHVWEAQEAKLREQLGDVAILRDRRGRKTRPLPLSVFRERMEAGKVPEPGPDFSCECFSEPEEAQQ